MFVNQYSFPLFFSDLVMMYLAVVTGFFITVSAYFKYKLALIFSTIVSQRFLLPDILIYNFLELNRVFRRVPIHEMSEILLSNKNQNINTADI
jgi:hypothetical protein